MKPLDKTFAGITTKGWIIFSSITAIFIIGGFFLINQKSPKEKVIASVNIEKTDIILPDSVESLVSLPTKELISVSEIRIKKEVAAKPLKEQAIQQNNQPEKEQVTVNQLPILKPDFSSQKQSLKKIEGKEIYLNNLKLIDYRNYRKRPNLTVESIQLTGVPADLEKEEELKESEASSIEIAYYDYITKTTALLDKGDYKQALARLNIILTHYPQDLNALFYSGLCYYNLSEYSKATELFKQCLGSGFSNFDEEAEWLLAKSYEADSQTEKAKAIFQLIKERGGYYSKKF